MTSLMQTILHGAMQLFALAWIALAIWLATRPSARMAVLLPGRWWLAAVAAAMALWCWASAQAAYSPVATAAAHVRNVAMLAWLYVAFLPHGRQRLNLAIKLVYAMLFALSVAAVTSGAVRAAMVPGDDAIWNAAAPAIEQMLVMMLTASGGLLLIDQIVRSYEGPRRVPLLVAAGAMAALWAYDLNIFLISTLAGQAARTLIDFEPIVSALLIPPFIVAALDTGRDRVKLSRPLAFRGIIVIGLAAYLVLISLIGAFAKLVGRDYGEVVQSLILVSALGLGGLFFLSDRARGWANVMVSKHFFEHRYDYRAGWMRFTATIGDGRGEAGDLNRRVIRAIAELTGSPGGLMLLPGGGGDFRVGEQWNWPGQVAADDDLPLRSWFVMQETGHIVDLDMARNGDALPVDVPVPAWLLDDSRAWVMVPMLHFGRMMAAIVLHRPPVARALDWEDLDVLRIAGQQGASYLAESQGQEALSEARRFDEFNRRFAFIIHDVKNLASQLGLLAANAERHADNPEFRADMVDTLKLSVGRMGELLARLAPQQRGRELVVGNVDLASLLNEYCAEMRGRHVLLLSVGTTLVARGDDAAIRQIIGHLITNAIEASPPDEPIQLIAADEGARVRVDVLDRGCGMSRDFIRDRLFKPFVSTKDTGFGLGAYESRQLAEAMGGSIDVVSNPGKGSRFTLWLPGADATVPDVRAAILETEKAK